MGWSCRREAGLVLDAWTKACVAQTGSTNVFVERGVRFFFELDNVEHDDGAITGTIQKSFKKGGKDLCVEAGAFRIEGNGFVTKAPMFLTAVSGVTRAS